MVTLESKKLKYDDCLFRYVLPSVLFTNRAQCYLSMNKWDQAIDDCTEAIIRSYEGMDWMDSI